MEQNARFLPNRPLGNLVLKDKVQRFMESTGMYGKYEVGVDGLCMEEM